ncbi:unnamed protein product [Medioppia subpectinata]|uniref:Uncharacterized protein n=1 Tax=Medioppia subpectinata TaxID=1979941 RepID=A0A7R9QGE7_9ACAR|nr:unnamed protein product [Medioppia subpectinata]CAG2119558.1 unnamed protein product [Medioppia subpectinata]
MFDDRFNGQTSDSFGAEYSMTFAAPVNGTAVEGAGSSRLYITALVKSDGTAAATVKWVRFDSSGYQLSHNSDTQYKTSSIVFGDDFQPTLTVNMYLQVLKDGAASDSGGATAAALYDTYESVCFGQQSEPADHQYAKTYRCYRFTDSAGDGSQLVAEDYTQKAIEGLEREMNGQNIAYDSSAGDSVLRTLNSDHKTIGVFRFKRFNWHSDNETIYMFFYLKDRIISYCPTRRNLFIKECPYRDFKVLVNCSDYTPIVTTTAATTTTTIADTQPITRANTTTTTDTNTDTNTTAAGGGAPVVGAEQSPQPSQPSGPVKTTPKSAAAVITGGIHVGDGDTSTTPVPSADDMKGADVTIGIVVIGLLAVLAISVVLSVVFGAKYCAHHEQSVSGRSATTGGKVAKSDDVIIKPSAPTAATDGKPSGDNIGDADEHKSGQLSDEQIPSRSPATTSRQAMAPIVKVE